MILGLLEDLIELAILAAFVMTIYVMSIAMMGGGI